MVFLEPEACEVSHFEKILSFDQLSFLSAESGLFFSLCSNLSMRTATKNNDLVQSFFFF